MKSHPNLTHEEYTRIEAYLRAQAAFLKEDARRLGRWECFVMEWCPELRRHPWQERFYDHTTLREIDQAMRGKEEFYSDTHDLLSLFELQVDPMTSDQRREISRFIASQTGLFFPDKSIVQMSDQEIDTATMRLAAASVSSDPDLQTPASMKFLQWNVPFVLHTAVMMHTLPGRNGRKVRVQPTTLPLPVFRLWFQERLLRTVVARSQHAPENPLWVLPDGNIRGSQIATFPHRSEFNKLIQRVCEPEPRGRRPGSGSRFTDAEDFRQTVICDLRALRQQGRDDTQLELARLWYQNDHNPAAELDSLVAQIKRYCRTYGIPWEFFVAEARRT